MNIPLLTLTEGNISALLALEKLNFDFKWRTQKVKSKGKKVLINTKQKETMVSGLRVQS